MRNIRLSASARVGLILSGAWLLCDIARGWDVYYGEGPDNITESFAVFFGKIGAALCPDIGSDRVNWPSVPIAMLIVFLLPVVIWWIVRPMVSAYSSSLTARGSLGMPKN